MRLAAIVLVAAVTAGAAAPLPPGSLAPAPGTAFELFELDPKTSYSYEERDRTDADYFHGLAILKAAKINSSAELERLLREPANFTTPQRLHVRDGSFGLRYRGADGKRVDLLFAPYELPPQIELANEGFLVIGPAASRQLEALLEASLARAKKRTPKDCCPRNIPRRRSAD